MTALIKIPFASSGDKSAMPETDAGGGVNMTQGYGQAYSLDPATDPSAKRIERDKMNWLFNLITQAINEIQVGGVAPFISTEDNGGSPFAYKKGSVVLYNGVTYQSLEDNNTTTPPDSKWAELKNADNGLTRDDPFADIKADGAAAVATALSNLGLTYTSSMNSPGWYKLPGGLIIQWFSGPGLPAGGSQVVTYPIPFPNTMLGIACTPGATSAGGGTYGLQSIDPASCRIWNQSTTQSAQAGSIIAVGK